MLDDPELLRRYAEENAQDAFADFVRRHIDFVYAVAVRASHGNQAMAEDVVQMVFIDVARKAPSLARRSALAGWLHTATRFAAAKMIRTEVRRKAREEEAHAMQQLNAETTSAEEWQRIQPFLDDALGTLKDREREAVLLRFAEGRAFAEIGRRLSLTESAARSCVDRSLDKLHTFLSRRGAAITTAGLGAVLASPGGMAAPAGLAAKVAAAAFGAAGVAGGAGATFWSFMTSKTISAFVAVVLVASIAIAVNPNEIFRPAKDSPPREVAKDGDVMVSSATTADPQPQPQAATSPAAVETDEGRAAIVIDTSGSMRDPATGEFFPAVLDQVDAVLKSNQTMPWFQVLDADGRMVSSGSPWLRNDPDNRLAIRETLRRYAVFSNSNPVVGITRALSALSSLEGTPPGAIFVLGDEFTGDEQSAAARIDSLNPPDANGRRRATISAVAFSTWMKSSAVPHPTHVKYENLMRAVSSQHDGSFVITAAF